MNSRIPSKNHLDYEVVADCLLALWQSVESHFEYDISQPLSKITTKTGFVSVFFLLPNNAMDGNFKM